MRPAIPRRRAERPRSGSLSGMTDPSTRTTLPSAIPSGSSSPKSETDTPFPLPSTRRTPATHPNSVWRGSEVIIAVQTPSPESSRSPCESRTYHQKHPISTPVARPIESTGRRNTESSNRLSVNTIVIAAEKATATQTPHIHTAGIIETLSPVATPTHIAEATHSKGGILGLVGGSGSRDSSFTSNAIWMRHRPSLDGDQVPE